MQFLQGGREAVRSVPAAIAHRPQVALPRLSTLNASGWRIGFVTNK
jgi:hypothetical protein